MRVKFVWFLSFGLLLGSGCSYFPFGDQGARSNDYKGFQPNGGYPSYSDYSYDRGERLFINETACRPENVLKLTSVYIHLGTDGSSGSDNDWVLTISDYNYDNENCTTDILKKPEAEWSKGEEMSFGVNLLGECENLTICSKSYPLRITLHLHAVGEEKKHEISLNTMMIVLSGQYPRCMAYLPFESINAQTQDGEIYIQAFNSTCTVINSLSESRRGNFHAEGGYEEYDGYDGYGA